MPARHPVRRPVRAVVIAGVAAALLVGCAAAPPATTPSAAGTPSSTPTASATPVDIPPPARLPGIVTSADVEVTEDPLLRWESETAARVVQVTSTVDGVVQDVLWDAPAEPDAPLVVHVHSWGSGFDQEVGIPVARWAESAGWGFLQPDFRGRNDRPEATGSELATQDVVDAVDFAVAEAGIDPDRIYVTGFSGGGMMSLLLAARHPDRFAGAASWVPVYDLVTWFAYNRDVQPQTDYAEEILASCGGDPTADEAAREDCLARSPVTVMADIRDAGVPVYLAGGVADEVVPVVDTLRAFNALADADARIPDDVLAGVAVGSLPAPLLGDVAADARFTPEDPALVFSRTSAQATIAVFDAGHLFVYYPGLDWLARLDAAREAS